MLAAPISDHERDQAYNIAYALAYRNEVDRAFEWLEKAVEYNDPGLEIIVQDMTGSVCDNICVDPRWVPFLESVGQSPAQLGAIRFEVSLPK